LRIGASRNGFGTHVGNAEAGELRGLELVHTFVSSKDDWDNYEGLQWYAAAEYARCHPDDPDLAELLERVAKGKACIFAGARHLGLGDLRLQTSSITARHLGCLTTACGAAEAERWADDTHHLMSRPGCCHLTRSPFVRPRTRRLK